MTTNQSEREMSADELAADFMRRLAVAQRNRLRADLVVWGGLLLVVLVLVLLAR